MTTSFDIFKRTQHLPLCTSRSVLAWVSCCHQMVTLSIQTNIPGVNLDTSSRLSLLNYQVPLVLSSELLGMCDSRVASPPLHSSTGLQHPTFLASGNSSSVVALPSSPLFQFSLHTVAMVIFQHVNLKKSSECVST